MVRLSKRKALWAPRAGKAYGWILMSRSIQGRLWDLRILTCLGRSQQFLFVYAWSHFSFACPVRVLTALEAHNELPRALTALQQMWSVFNLDQISQVSIGCHRFSWRSMGFHRVVIGFHGFPWVSMAFRWFVHMFFHKLAAQGYQAAWRRVMFHSRRQALKQSHLRRLWQHSPSTGSRETQDPMWIRIRLEDLEWWDTWESIRVYHDRCSSLNQDETASRY